jgi:hypothetical protein
MRHNVEKSCHTTKVVKQRDKPLPSFKQLDADTFHQKSLLLEKSMDLLLDIAIECDEEDVQEVDLTQHYNSLHNSIAYQQALLNWFRGEG